MLNNSVASASSEEEILNARGYFSDSDIKFNYTEVPLNQQSIMNLSLKDFEFKRVLGVGAFGAVWLVLKKSTKDEYALKIIDFS